MCGTGDKRLCLFKTARAEWAKRCSCTGVFLLYFTVCISSFWGNLSVYTESYFRHLLGPNVEISAAWLLSYCSIGTGIGGVAAGHIARYIGRHWTLVIGCAFYDCGFFLSALSVKHSVFSLNLTLGLLGGLGTGVTLTMGLEHVMGFRPKYIGMATAAITSGRHFGAAFWNQLITWCINPANLVPDLFEDHQKYFTQAEVLDRVPSVFLVLGVVFLCFHVIGMSMIWSNDKYLENRGCLVQKNIGGVEDDEEQPTEVGSGPITSSNSTKPPKKDEASLTRNISTRQMLKTKTFYLVCFLYVCGQYTDFSFVCSFKQRGLLWIPDDQFLTTLSTVVVLMMILAQPVFGGLIDVFGLKHSVMILCFALCVLSNFWYFTPMVCGRWLYFVWTAICGGGVSGMYVYIPVMTLNLYGTEHFSKNYGIVTCSRIVASLLSPLLIQFLLNNYGWFYLFFSGGCINALGVLLTMIWLPRN